MGYDLHITRAPEWSESDQHPITADEWLAVVAADPELSLRPGHEPYFAEWSGPCSHPGGSWFSWDEGQIYTKNPDRRILAKMLQIAGRLGARVQGDDGELYDAPEDLPSDEALAASKQRARRPW
jgi:hypothetical protein